MMTTMCSVIPAGLIRETRNRMATKDQIPANVGKDHAHDEREPGEPIQPGDLVIEIRNGKPVVYTQPEGGRDGH
jgi:hypothetical protein